MRVIYIEAEQGHAVPKSVMEARGPFAHYEPQPAEEDYQPMGFPPGATAQNGMKEVIFYECNECGATIREGELDYHECEE